MAYELHAEFETGMVETIGHFRSKAKAAAKIEELEDNENERIEGAELVLVHKATGMKWFYSDGWEPLDC